MTLHTDDQQSDTLAPAATEAAAAATVPVPGFAAALRSEWAKLWSVRSSWILFGLMLALTIGLSAVMAFFGSAGDLAKAQSEGRYDVIFFSATLGVWIFTYIASNIVAVEYSRKIGQYTFIATPNRDRVLTAKLTIVAGAALALGLLIALSNVALTQTALAAGGFHTLDMDSGSFWRAILIYIPLSMFVQGMLGALAALLTRNPFGGLAVVILLNALPVTLAQFLGEGYRATIPRIMPGAAVESLAGLSPVGSDGWLPAPLALLVILLWVAVGWALCRRRMVRGDV